MYNKMINQTEDHLQVFKDFLAQQEKISVKICVLQLSFWELVLFELFDRRDAEVTERVFLTSLSLVSFQVPRNIYMFIAFRCFIKKVRDLLNNILTEMFSGWV